MDRFEAFTTLVAKISRSIRKIKNQEMAYCNLRNSHISCLYLLYANNTLTATELCEKCEEDKATISRSLDFLESEGYVIRNSEGQKKYKSPLMLTEKGKCAGKRISDKIESVLNEIGVELTETERDSMYKCLNIISDGLERIADN